MKSEILKRIILMFMLMLLSSPLYIVLKAMKQKLYFFLLQKMILRMRLFIQHLLEQKRIYTLLIMVMKSMMSFFQKIYLL